MRIGVVGSTGRVGRRLVELGCLPIVCDITDYKSVDSALTQSHPDIVVNTASHSDVDWCEKKEHQSEVIAVNYVGAQNIANVSHQLKIGMVQLSTDHIFNGKHGPYKEDYRYYVPNIFGRKEFPVNYYGMSKVAAEGLQLVYPNMKIVRTSYLFDKERIDKEYKQGHDYPTFMFRSFMWINHFTDSLMEYLRRFYEMPNILNISGSKTVSWHTFMLLALSGYEESMVIPRGKELKNSVAPRPYKAGLNTSLSAKLGLPQYDYKQGLMQMEKE